MSTQPFEFKIDTTTSTTYTTTASHKKHNDDLGLPRPHHMQDTAREILQLRQKKSMFHQQTAPKSNSNRDLNKSR